MSQQQKSPHEEFIMTFLVFFIVVGLALVIWHFFSLQITNFVRWVRVLELTIVQTFFGGGTNVTFGEFRPQNVSTWRKWLKDIDVKDISVMDIRVSTYVALIPLRNAFVAMIAVMAAIVLFKGPGTGYRRRMGLEALMKEQSRAFPVISPFLKFDPRTLPVRAPGQPVPAQLPIFSEALTPEEWMAHNEIGMAGGQIDFNKAHHALMKQLGNRWRGPQNLPIHAQGLFAAFALKHARKRKDSDQLLADLALCWSAEGGFKPSSKLRSKIRGIIKNPKLGGALMKYADMHGYETTALLRSLARARDEGGVLAPAQFVWLRGLDRNLWYPLNNLGRKSYHAEAAGAMVHYTNELIAGQKIPTPRFEDVIRTIDKYMKSGAARAIPELDRKATGKYWKKK